MVTENVDNNAEACREKPKKWDETYKVDVVNNIDVDSMQNLEIQLENLNILSQLFSLILVFPQCC
jgi:hypothetical protein